MDIWLFLEIIESIPGIICVRENHYDGYSSRTYQGVNNRLVLIDTSIDDFTEDTGVGHLFELGLGDRIASIFPGALERLKAEYEEIHKKRLLKEAESLKEVEKALDETEEKIRLQNEAERLRLLAEAATEEDRKILEEKRQNIINSLSGKVGKNLKKNISKEESD